MEKIADNYYLKKESHPVSEGVVLDMTIDFIDGEDLDTVIDIKGSFCIAGNTRAEFIKILGGLIDEYRI